MLLYKLLLKLYSTLNGDRTHNLRFRRQLAHFHMRLYSKYLRTYKFYL